MRLRTALKIRKAIGTDRECRYTDGQLYRALNRYDRLKSAKEDKSFFHACMQNIGVEGRAWLISHWDPAGALRLLMETPEGEWKGTGELEERRRF